MKNKPLKFRYIILFYMLPGIIYVLVQSTCNYLETIYYKHKYFKNRIENQYSYTKKRTPNIFEIRAKELGYGEISSITGRPKTKWVSGYYRS